ncbi:hypothetical protein ACIGDI_39805 [Streptomyces sp. NPDC085900]|uniref:hypothetical protein n=1 Tax=Streptomyces sp. NPDC085900 TaxID=3365737 RepID=UPI0037D41684
MPSIMTLSPVLDDRPPLPMRPTPHERDGRDPSPDSGRPHPQQHAAGADPTMTEVLRRVVDRQIGPREVGAIYRNTAGVFEVLVVVRDPEAARALLRRRSAHWALIVKDITRHDGEPHAIGSVWTTSDFLVREAGARRTVEEAIA